VGGDWRRGFEYAWHTPDPERDEGPGLTLRQLTPATGPARVTRRSAATSHATATAGSPTSASNDPAGLSPIITVGWFDTVEEAQVASDEMWASR